MAWYRRGARFRRPGQLSSTPGAETIDRKPTFRKAFRERRCIIPTDGFFLSHAGTDRWRRTYRISGVDGEPLPFAGIWEVWRSAQGAALRSSAIVTVPANSAVAPIHDRMPAILLDAEQRVWLGSRAEVSELKAVLHPCSPELLKVEEVGPDESGHQLELPFRF